MIRLSWISAVSFVAALLLSSMLVDHGTVEDRLRGPGLTIDESFNIEQGVYLVDALVQHGPLIFLPSEAKKVFGSPKYNPDHPPLGRIVLGVAHYLTAWCIPGSESTAYNVPAARLGSCLAFAMTVLLLTEFCQRRYGWATAVCVAILMISTTCLIGHARLAALESTTNLAWVAALLPLLAWWTDARPPSTLRACISGVFWGLLLLTKVQGILLPPVVLLWAAWQYRWHGLRPLLCWSVCGAIVFLFAWPWLWSNPIHNLQQYLGRSPNRSILYCWYFGERFADKQVPWHYPFVITLFTLPFGVLLC
ncbi:MAG: glycosyltransferase family 39 protein, partial [Fuerstia sp.]|nr:glycosyltransferase family 39 protein [Fuerstiella sp.]